MLLLNICVITSGNKVLQIRLAFLSDEKTESYTWVIGQLIEIIKSQNIQQPLSIVTDREIALINSIDTFLPQSSHILCHWHANINVLAKTKKFFPGPIKGDDSITCWHPKFKEFMVDWISLLNSSTLDKYQKNLDHLRRYPRGAVDYIERAWLYL